MKKLLEKMSVITLVIIPSNEARDWKQNTENLIQLHPTYSTLVTQANNA